MGLVSGQVEKRMSAMLGTDVTLEKLHFSLLGGSVEAQGVTVAGSEPGVPLLTIRRVRAEISIGAAFKKEFVVKSLTVEKPVLTVVRRADGSLNVPARLSEPAATDASDTARQTSVTPTDTSANEVVEGSWRFEAKKVLLLDGEIHYRDASGYHLSLEKILGDIKEVNNALDFTVVADSVARRDVPADLGAIRAQGRALNVPNLAQWQRASIHAGFEVGALLRGQVDVSSVNPLDVKAEFDGRVNLADVRAFAPENVKAFDALRDGRVRGIADVKGRATFHATTGLRVPEFTLHVVDLAIDSLAALLGRNE